MTSSTKETCDIPSINLKPFFREEGVVIGQAPTQDQLDVAATIHKACQEHGFVHVTQFGLTKEMGDRLFAASKELFDCPTKLQDYSPWHPSHNTGYSPFRNEALNTNRPPDLKEAFNVRFPPSCDVSTLVSKTPTAFQTVVNNDYNNSNAKANGFSFFDVLRTAALRYSMACSLALELPIDFFSRTLNKFDSCTVRFLHYPPCCIGEVTVTDPANQRSSPTNAPIRVGEHTDFGMITFLLLGKQGPMGLQVKSVAGGEIGGEAGGEEDGWKDVVIPDLSNKDDDDPESKHEESSFGAVINTGALMARWTNDHWKATAHRVIVPTAEAASTDRYSIAFFVDPDAHELIEVDKKFASGDSSCYDSITSSDFLQMKLNEMAGAARNT